MKMGIEKQGESLSKCAAIVAVCNCLMLQENDHYCTRISIMNICDYLSVSAVSLLCKNHSHTLEL